MGEGDLDRIGSVGVHARIEERRGIASDVFGVLNVAGGTTEVGGILGELNLWCVGLRTTRASPSGAVSARVRSSAECERGRPTFGEESECASNLLCRDRLGGGGPCGSEVVIPGGGTANAVFFGEDMKFFDEWK